ncbi:MAG: HAD superfamily hydrolase (TIGR01549 family) [Candidatus Pseudothioglobus sp.]|jgi:putative hydrolase of the HAD superfamily
MIKVIAFDLDDTLWAVKPVIIRAEKRLDIWLREHVNDLQYDVTSMRELRHDLIKAEPALAKMITELRRRIIELAMLKSGRSETQARALSTQAIEVFLVARNDIQLYEGAIDTISTLAADYRLGALSNGNADIQRVGLDKYFDFAFSAEMVGAPKPDPTLFQAALTHTGAAPHEMLYVGDDPTLDVDAAKQLGLHTIWLKTAAKPVIDQTVPDETIEDIRDLPAAVKRLLIKLQ